MTSRTGDVVPPALSPSAMSQPMSLLDLQNMQLSEAAVRRRKEAQADHERCQVSEENLLYMAQHAFNVSTRWEEMQPEVRAQQVAATGRVTKEMREDWDLKDKNSRDEKEKAKFNILQVKRVQRWRKKIARWPGTFYMGCPVQSTEDQAANPGPGMEVLCRVSCLRCSEFHHTLCSCRKGWSPRTVRVEERLEEDWERKAFAQAESKLKEEIAEEKLHRAMAEEGEEVACFQGRLTTLTPATGVGPGAPRGKDGVAPAATEVGGVETSTEEEGRQEAPPPLATLLKAQFSDGLFYKAEAILVRAARPRVKVRILEGPGQGLEIYEAPSQLEWPLPGDPALPLLADGAGATVAPTEPRTRPPEPSRLPPHSPKYRQQWEDVAPGGHAADQETQEEQRELLAAGADYFGEVENASRVAPRPIYVNATGSSGSGSSSAQRTASLLDSASARWTRSHGSEQVAMPPWQRDDDFDETSYHEG